MKRLLLFLLLFIIVQNISFAQSLELGLRDNQYAHANFKSSQGWLIGYEQSFLNVKLKEQSGRIFTGYVINGNNWGASGTAYFGTDYCGTWKTYGFLGEGIYNYKRLFLDGIINPYYDTSLKYTFSYQIEAGLTLLNNERLLNKVDLCVSYGNIPEYRLSVNYIRAGIKISSGNLWVKPMISFPNIDNDAGHKYIRVLCSLGWSFNFNNK